MDLRSNNPYWLLKTGIVATYPSLSKDLKTEVAIIGAGITGALIAWHLCRAGIGAVIIDKRHVGMGSTAASTALLQYDNRIVVGGKDEDFSDPVKRDEKLSLKSRELEMAFAKKFPQVPFKTDFRWAGTFASTKDGLPYIGTIAERPHTFFALGFGGNGITYSLIAAQIIRDKISGKKNDNAEIFSFNR